MQIAGSQGGASQVAVNQANSSGKGKTEAVNNNNASFLSAVKEVAESVSGKIVVAGGADVEELNILKRDAEYRMDVPEKIETVYDFIGDQEPLKREKGKVGPENIMVEFNADVNFAPEVLEHATDAEVEVDSILSEIKSELVNSDFFVDEVAEFGTDSLFRSEN